MTWRPDARTAKTGRHPDYLRQGDTAKQPLDRPPLDWQAMIREFHTSPPDARPVATDFASAHEAASFVGHLANMAPETVHEALRDLIEENRQTLEVVKDMKTRNMPDHAVKALLDAATALQYNLRRVQGHTRLEKSMSKAKKQTDAVDTGKEEGVNDAITHPKKSVAHRYTELTDHAKKHGLKIKGKLSEKHDHAHLDELEKQLSASVEQRKAKKQAKASELEENTAVWARGRTGPVSWKKTKPAKVKDEEYDPNGHDVPGTPHARVKAAKKVHGLLDKMAAMERRMSEGQMGLYHELVEQGSSVLSEPSPQATAWFEERVGSFLHLVRGYKDDDQGGPAGGASQLAKADGVLVFDATGRPLLRKNMRPPPGFSPIPNSKKGGFHKRDAGGYAYWYPGMGEPRQVTNRAVAEELHRLVLEGYNLEVIGRDPARAKAIADRIKAGIDGNADICKLNPEICTGNMGIPRSHMPQIMDKSPKALLASSNPKDQRKGHAAVAMGADPEDDKSTLDHFKAALEKDGVKITSGEKVKVGLLKATQREILADKTYGIANAYLQGKFDPFETSVMVSSDNYVLDGHHRWSAALTADPKRALNVIRLGIPMKELLNKAHAFQGVFRADMHDNIVPPGEPLDLSGGQDKISVSKGFARRVYARFEELRKSDTPYSHGQAFAIVKGEVATAEALMEDGGQMGRKIEALLWAGHDHRQAVNIAMDLLKGEGDQPTQDDGNTQSVTSDDDTEDEDDPTVTPEFGEEEETAKALDRDRLAAAGEIQGLLTKAMEESRWPMRQGYIRQARAVAAPWPDLLDLCPATDPDAQPVRKAVRTPPPPPPRRRVGVALRSPDPTNEHGHRDGLEPGMQLRLRKAHGGWDAKAHSHVDVLDGGRFAWDGHVYKSGSALLGAIYGNDKHNSTLRRYFGLGGEGAVNVRRVKAELDGLLKAHGVVTVVNGNMIEAVGPLFKAGIPTAFMAHEHATRAILSCDDAARVVEALGGRP